MHPFLTNRRWLLPYLFVWTLLSVIPAALLSPAGADQWLQSSVMAWIPAILFALTVLPGWYLCRAMRPSWSVLPRLLAAHGTAAVGFSLVWLGLSEATAQLVALVPGWEDAPLRLADRRTEMFAVGALFYCLSAAFHYLLLSLQAQRESDAKAAAMTVKAREAALSALKAQVHPHFLFNSLNTISALVTRDPGQARQMCILLADFLRLSLRTTDQRAIPLGDELALMRAYLGVEKIRLGTRLDVHESVQSDCEKCLVPPLLLQPLVENAVKHGIALLEQGGTLTLEAKRDKGDLCLRITNPFDPTARARTTEGLGLKTVHARLRGTYEDEASMEIRRTEGFFDIAIRMPIDHPANERR